MTYKYIFILGRNPELSIYEIECYLQNNKIKYNYIQNSNAILIELDKELSREVINFLGGTIAIGKVLCNVNELERYFIYNGEKNKITYSVWNYSEKYNEKVSEILKNKFKIERMKAVNKKLTGKLDLQEGISVSIVSKDTDIEYFVFENYFGEIMAKSKYKDIENRDMNKPVRRESLAISPRLSKIMINMSQTKKGGRIVDPFCGIGVILSEALLMGYEVVGIDKDKNAIEGAISNLEWMGFSKKKYKLINFDSTKVDIFSADSLVSEPDLGIVLKKSPNKEVAKKILKNYEGLIIRVLNNLKENINGRFIFTSPYILVNNKRIGCNIDRICGSCKLRMVKSFKEYRKDQIVARNIFVLEH
jgi:tRNA G10  N-methylase Trm11